ncbi:MAG: trypsin-like peptidase domain-containing protein [Amylibacter sp.]|nr:trypsin-like peptidase domain-containing protein [Amylibacter sp.]
MRQIIVFFSTLIILTLGISNAWALPNCVGPYSTTNWKNCFGSFTWSNGDKYLGDFKDGNRTGQGTYTYANGDKYIGRFNNNDMNGWGSFFYASGEIYIGAFKDNSPHGHGTRTFAPGSEWEGDKYVGEHKNNMMHGQGTYTYASGEIQEGIFKDGKFLYAQTKTLPNCPSSGDFHNCFGTYTWANGNKYVGEWQNNKRNGQGINTWADGEKYIGEWQNDKRNGQGNNTWANGEKHVGLYKNDLRHGQGTYTYANGDTYEGGYKNDDRDGQGTYTYANGRKEVGEFKNNALNGYATKYFANGTIDKQGIFKDDEFLYAQTKTLPNCPSSGYFHNCFGLFKYDNGDKYLGEWQNDKSHGQGTYTWADGEKYVGEWQNDQKHGQGTYIYSTGNKYVGRYKNSKKHGQGIFTWANGDRYVGEYKNGMSNGQGTYTWGNGKWKGDKYVGKFKNDQRHGRGTYTHANGDTYEGGYKNNLMDGQGTYTYANGRKEVGEFKNDKLNGYAIKYYADGSIDQEGIFKDDEFLYAEESSPNILNKDNQDNEVINASSGSGFAVSPDGYVITNNHVIEGCQEVILHTKEKDIKTRVIAFDPQNDLALLKGDFQPKTVFALSNNRPELLQDIYVAGYPFGNAISSSIKVTKGIVSSLTGIGNNFSNIQIDAALQSGNSGGPIIDDNGNVIAVAVSKLDAKYMLENFGSIPENTNFGIKSSVVKSILDSNDVTRPDANQSEISKTKLGKMISSGTYYISCWMTQAQIELLKSKKVLFEGLN